MVPGLRPFEVFFAGLAVREGGKFLYELGRDILVDALEKKGEEAFHKFEETHPRLHHLLHPEPGTSRRGGLISLGLHNNQPCVNCPA